ncbi:MAG: hypothetical protein KDK38_12960, partial [Leptospiraceae bacterium]|nr:hypothetical protein [Leptospiraceae bacterium]
MAVIEIKKYCQGVMKVYAVNFAVAFVFSVIFSVGSGSPALAQEVDDIAKNIVSGSDQLPGLISAISYGLGLLLGVLGVLKLKDHVENPTQTPLR